MKITNKTMKIRRMPDEMNKDFLSTSDLADILGISRVAVFKNIDKKKIPATRIGRAFVVSKKDLPKILRWFSTSRRTK